MFQDTWLEQSKRQKFGEADNVLGSSLSAHQKDPEGTRNHLWRTRKDASPAGWRARRRLRGGGDSKGERDSLAPCHRGRRARSSSRTVREPATKAARNGGGKNLWGDRLNGGS